jgi:hypothetical protein
MGLYLVSGMILCLAALMVDWVGTGLTEGASGNYNDFAIDCASTKPAAAIGDGSCTV